MKFQFLHKNLRDTNYINDYESKSIYKNSTRRRLCGYTSRIDTGLIIFASQPPLAADCRIKRAAMTVSITSLYARSTVPWLASSIFTSETERVERRRLEEVQARRDRDRLIGAPMPCLPDGFQLCRTICQALPRPRSFHIGLAGPPSGRRPIRDINTTDPTSSLSLSPLLPSLSILLVRFCVFRE